MTIENVTSGADTRTSLMVRHVPNKYKYQYKYKYTQAALCSLLPLQR